MSRIWERHTGYYLDYAEAHLENWAWFDAEWTQIQRAWEWVSSKSQDNKLALRYVQSFYPLQDQHNLWQASIAWSERGLEAARSLCERQTEGKILGNLGDLYKDQGDFRLAHHYLTQALSIFEEIQSPFSNAIRGSLMELEETNPEQ